MIDILLMMYDSFVLQSASAVKHTFQALFGTLSTPEYSICRVDSEFYTPRAIGPLFLLVFKEYFTKVLHIVSHVFKSLFF